MLLGYSFIYIVFRVNSCTDMDLGSINRSAPPFPQPFPLQNFASPILSLPGLAHVLLSHHHHHHLLPP